MEACNNCFKLRNQEKGNSIFEGMILSIKILQKDDNKWAIDYFKL